MLGKEAEKENRTRGGVEPEEKQEIPGSLDLMGRLTFLLLSRVFPTGLHQNTSAPSIIRKM